MAFSEPGHRSFSPPVLTEEQTSNISRIVDQLRGNFKVAEKVLEEAMDIPLSYQFLTDTKYRTSLNDNTEHIDGMLCRLATAIGKKDEADRLRQATDCARLDMEAADKALEAAVKRVEQRETELDQATANVAGLEARLEEAGIARDAAVTEVQTTYLDFIQRLEGLATVLSIPSKEDLSGLTISFKYSPLQLDEM